MRIICRMEWTITQIASVVLCAMGLGLAFSLFGYAPALGYIIAGIVLGPSGFRLIIDRQCASLLSELGIMLLLFVIGLGLSFDKIRNIWKNSVGVTFLSLVLMLIVSSVAGYVLRLTFAQTLLLAFCLTLSSTAISVKSLHQIPSVGEHIETNAYGIYIVQDVIALFMVLVLNMFGPEGLNQKAIYKCLAIGFFVFGLIFYFAKYHKHIHKLTNFIRKHDDMLGIIIFGLCLGGALLSELVGLSAAFGAFIVGLILGNSNLMEETRRIASPVEELLLMVFFLGVGLMVDLQFIWQNLGLIFLAVLLVMVGKTIIIIMTLRFLKFDLRASFIIGVLLAHIGEFSFMLVYTALRQGIVDIYGMHFLVSLTAISLFLCPFWVKFAERCRSLAHNVVDTSAWEFFKLVNRNEFGKCRRMLAFVVTITKDSVVFAYEKAKHFRKKKKLIDEIKKNEVKKKTEEQVRDEYSN